MPARGHHIIYMMLTSCTLVAGLQPLIDKAGCKTVARL